MNDETRSLLDKNLEKLDRAIARGSADNTCLRLWSRFVRARDGGCCVICDSRDRIAAHHICRKTLMREARFMTGNGITLCRFCHTEAHAVFNGRADLTWPMDAQGGEKLDMMAEQYGQLAQDAARRHPGQVDYYFLSNAVIDRFKFCKGIDHRRLLAGSPIEQAWYIWSSSDVSVVSALLRANLGC